MEISPGISNGVSSINNLTGAITLAAGTNITLTPVGNTITISSNDSAVAIGGTVTGGTTGSVLFVNPTGILAQDNANFFWDDTNNRLGIGTATPGAKLTSYANTDSTNVELLRLQNDGGGAGAGSKLSFYQSGNGETGYIQNTYDATFSGFTTAINGLGFLTLKTAGANRLSIDGSGNVGIGTTSPATSLQITHAATTTLSNIKSAISSNAINLEGTYTAGSNYLAGLTFSTSDNVPTAPKAGIWVNPSSTGSYLYIGTSNNYTSGITNQAFTIDPSGNVGIGTTLPDMKLKVVGTAGLPATSGSTQNGSFRIVAGTNSVLDFGNSDIASDYANWIQSTNQTALGSYLTLLLNPRGGLVGIGTASPGAQLQVTAGAAGTIGQIIKGAASQSANLLELQDSSTNILTAFNKDGYIFRGSDRFLHNFGTNNTFLGVNSGNFTLSTAGSNVGLGVNALTSLTTGGLNAAVGVSSLIGLTTGLGNTAIGCNVLTSLSTGVYNVGVGLQALLNLTGADSNNVAVGVNALYATNGASNNIGIGFQAGYTATPANANVTGANNVWVGHNSGPGTTTQLSNSIALGYQALVSASDTMVLGGTGGGSVQVAINATTAVGQFDVNVNSASRVGQIIKGAASRVVALLNLQTSAGASLGNVGGTIFNNFTTTSTTHTDGTEDDLYSYTTVANTFAINGDSITENEHVQFVASATASRRLKKYFAGTLIFDSGALTLSLGGDFILETIVIRESSTVVRCSVSVVTTSASSVPYATYTRITGLTLTGTNILKTTGIAAGVGAASGDISDLLAKVIAMPAA